MALLDFYQAHPLWIWLAVAGVLLAAEVATSTGWLLWPAGSAAAVAVVALITRRLGLPGEVVVFAVLTVGSTLAARKLLPRQTLQPGPDINDRAGHIVGKTGRVVGAFTGGAGRVMVDGAEWAALSDSAALNLGDQVEVVCVVSGAKLEVKAV